jgi:hypothetical protein
LHILAIAIPCKNPMYCRGMSQIVQARWMQLSLGALDFSHLAQALKQGNDLRIRPPVPSARSEQARVIALRHRQAPTALDMRGQFRRQPLPNRYQTSLEEFRIVYGDDAVDQVRIQNGQPQRFADAQPLPYSRRINVMYMDACCGLR